MDELYDLLVQICIRIVKKEKAQEKSEDQDE